MSVRPIRITGDPVLHTPARPVTNFGEELDELVFDMIDTMREAPGVGLAAPQIGVDLQVFVWEWSDEHDKLHEGAIVNPVLSLGQRERGPLDEEGEIEGCLSVPDFRYPLRRASDVVLSGLDPQGHALSMYAEGWLARIFQHEFDHLQGRLYIDRLAWRLRREARRDIRREGFAQPGRSWLPGVDSYEESDHEAEEA